MKDETSQYKLHFLKTAISFNLADYCSWVGEHLLSKKMLLPTRDFSPLFAGPIGKKYTVYEGSNLSSLLVVLVLSSGSINKCFLSAWDSRNYFIYRVDLSPVGLTHLCVYHIAGLVICRSCSYQLPAITWSLKGSVGLSLLLLFLTPLSFQGRFQVKSVLKQDKRSTNTSHFCPQLFYFLLVWQAILSTLFQAIWLYWWPAANFLW